MIQGEESLFLGVDLGTSSVKAIIVDSAGKVVGQGSAGYPIHHPQPTHAEQAPEAWWDATIQAVRQAIASLSDSHAIVALSVTGQMHGTVLLDETAQLLGPAIIWPDQRSHAESILRRLSRSLAQVRVVASSSSVPAASLGSVAKVFVSRQRR